VRAGRRSASGGWAGSRRGIGDLFVAFSTAPDRTARAAGRGPVRMVPDEQTDALNEATVQATEEAIINAMLAARTMRGADGLVVPALPHDRLKAILRKYHRLK
jgi:L-aminopeptidase/D-esterase-like protein